MTKGTLRELGVQHEYIYHSPGIGKDEYIKEKLQSIANVSRAITLMRSSRILSIGYSFGGMTLGDMGPYKDEIRIRPRSYRDGTLPLIAHGINVNRQRSIPPRPRMK